LNYFLGVENFLNLIFYTKVLISIFIILYTWPRNIKLTDNEMNCCFIMATWTVVAIVGIYVYYMKMKNLKGNEAPLKM
jgi:hypothetical protein